MITIIPPRMKTHVKQTALQAISKDAWYHKHILVSTHAAIHHYRDTFSKQAHDLTHQLNECNIMDTCSVHESYI